MKEERKRIIRLALDYDIQDIHTYSGYKGDLVLKIVTKDKETLSALRSFALSIGVKEVIIKQNVDMRNYEIYCVSEGEDIYGLKTVDVLDEIHMDHLIEDQWDKKK